MYFVTTRFQQESHKDVVAGIAVTNELRADTIAIYIKPCTGADFVNRNKKINKKMLYIVFMSFYE